MLRGRRLSQPPDPIAEAARRRGPVLVRGEIVPIPTRGTPPVPATLPYGLEALLPAKETVLAWFELEEEFRPLARAEREQVQRGRDFVVADASGRALVRISAPGAGGRLDDGVELTLHAPPSHAELAPTATLPRRKVWWRALCAGDRVIVAGRPTLAPDEGGLGGSYREAPQILTFSSGIEICDEAAFDHLAAWARLPWYRKLSVFVRNK